MIERFSKTSAALATGPLDTTKSLPVGVKLRLAAEVFTHSREAIAVTDATGAILDVNAAFTCITGYSRAEVLGQNPKLLKSGRQSHAFYADLWRNLLDNGHWPITAVGSHLAARPELVCRVVAGWRR